MHRTAFAGLTAPDENDSITVDGGSFVYANPDITDRLLRVGCITHRHDEHAAIPNPVGSLSASVSASGGQIEGGTAVYMGYTFADPEGGETTLSQVVVATTPDLIEPDLAPPTASASYAAGTLPAGEFSYAFNYRDAAGGQTGLQPAVFVTRIPGPEHGEVIFSGLSAGLVSGLVSWEAWRADGGSEYQLLASGATDGFTDTGFTCTDCTRTPPTQNTTNHTCRILIGLPDEGSDAALASASSINLYLSTDGSFSSPSLYASYPVASAGAVVTVPTLVLGTGAPPAVNRSLPGAHKINLDTETLGPFRGAVAAAEDLPLEGNTDGDVRLTRDTYTLWVWEDGGGWTEMSGGGGGGGASGHIIQNPAGAPMTAEPKLQFTGASVTVTDDAAHNRTVVNIAAASGGGGGEGEGSSEAPMGWAVGGALEAGALPGEFRPGGKIVKIVAKVHKGGCQVKFNRKEETLKDNTKTTIAAMAAIVVGELPTVVTSGLGTGITIAANDFFNIEIAPLQEEDPETKELVDLPLEAEDLSFTVYVE